MEVASHQEEDHDMPIPLNTTYGHSGGGHSHMIHHHHVGYKINNKEKHVVIKYKECMKNHAASMGGNAIDGCGEFMPSGEEGSIEALTCSACNCHRNFHRREIEGEETKTFSPYYHYHNHQPQRKLMFHHHNHHKMIMPIGGSNSESEDLMEESLTFRQPPPPQPTEPPYSYGGYNQKKRFRTKFTQEQKEKMLRFAERVGWKMQKQEESVVQQFCQEIGVKRRVLKVWMHNNKHILSKKSNNVNNNVDLSAANNNDIHNVTN